ncbi:FAD-binding oxidoreductase [Microbulbifer sp. OS29]|uniref:FAD-binding oxidoreductase n=1 Tax=Microbulbifer okhotskensis TaxID=2926617 RepID=A0A9X2ERY0_9GAMM|nr:FAD-binding oxidoreductase [Microbulbifer okhotskensis]MCO1336290.1 FAD-binding oxidoreductase [Microbulbifer okhotskensis]
MSRWWVVFFLLCAQAFAVEIKPFKTDGCSAFPDGTFNQHELWLDCCIAHDYAYWKGGSYKERKQADRALEVCVAGTGEEEVALVMLMGVRLGGTPFLPTPFRWGYGWPYLRGYEALSASELQAIQQADGDL